MSTIVRLPVEPSSGRSLFLSHETSGDFSSIPDILLSAVGFLPFAVNLLVSVRLLMDAGQILNSIGRSVGAHAQMIAVVSTTTVQMSNPTRNQVTSRGI